MGTVAFEKLPALSIVAEGDMYNISDQFTTTVNFKEGAGLVIPAGSNVYKTADGKWDVLAGSPVASVNGQTGNVHITKENIELGNVDNTADANKPVSKAQQAALDGKISKSGDTVTGPLDMNGISTSIYFTDYPRTGAHAKGLYFKDPDDNTVSGIEAVSNVNGDGIPNRLFIAVDGEPWRGGGLAITKNNIKWKGNNLLTEASIEDTGWKDIGLIGSTAYSPTQTPQYRKVGNIVEVSGSVNGVTGANSSNLITIGKIPNSVAPSKPVRELCQGSGYNKWLLTIETDGYMYATRYGGTSAATTMTGDEWFPFHATYITNGMQIVNPTT